MDGVYSRDDPSVIAQPTAEEKANSVNGKYVTNAYLMYVDLVLIMRLRWIREGVFKFGFELRK